MKEEYTDSKIIIWEGWVNVKVHICAYIMEEILHQLIGSLSRYYLPGFIHPRWCSGAGFLPSTVSIPYMNVRFL